ncbi:unnamed protein product [Protopolystoma xenopodis]|uniref:Uncharacterized protein n=1 Tax=Protopolystoma xenopodis TaxID=117903 RepID=A0A448WTT6_9PLAT|nr:unnamed protein product [Protopolystoma xenopodis]
MFMQSDIIPFGPKEGSFCILSLDARDNLAVLPSYHWLIRWLIGSFSKYKSDDEPTFKTFALKSVYTEVKLGSLRYREVSVLLSGLFTSEP